MQIDTPHRHRSILHSIDCIRRLYSTLGWSVFPAAFSPSVSRVADSLCLVVAVVLRYTVWVPPPRRARPVPAFSEKPIHTRRATLDSVTGENPTFPGHKPERGGCSPHAVDKAERSAKRRRYRRLDWLTRPTLTPTLSHPLGRTQISSSQSGTRSGGPWLVVRVW